MVEPTLFNGGSAEYCTFIDAFDTLIGTTDSSPKRKQFYLLRYTSALANALAKGCQYLPDDEGYAKARQLLEDTFGNSFKLHVLVCICFGPLLKAHDKIGITNFYAKLASSICTLSGISYLHKIDNINIISKATRRMPQCWQSGWMHSAHVILHVLYIKGKLV